MELKSFGLKMVPRTHGWIAVAFGVTLAFLVFIQFNGHAMVRVFQTGRETFKLQRDDIMDTTKSAIRTVNSTRSATIALMDGWQNVGHGYPQQIKAGLQHCEYKCELRVKKKGESHAEADLVYFHVTGLPKYPLRKYDGQVWLLRTLESPHFLAHSLEPYNEMFNYTATFYPNSSIQLRWGYYTAKLGARTVKDYAVKHKELVGDRSSAKALWFVSNCQLVHSGRNDYVDALAEFLQIDVFSHRIERCQDKLSKVTILPSSARGNTTCSYCGYTFYLSFENALCKSYITEKLWNILRSEALAIPVVLGGYSMADYAAIAPPNSFIHVNNFSSPEHLARHLHSVATDNEAFNYYHRWRDQYVVPEILPEDRDQACKICEFAHKKPMQIIDHLDQVITRKDCHDLSTTKNIKKFYNIT